MNAIAPLTDAPEKLRLRAEDFELLEESGAFANRSKAELIDGDIYVVNAQFARHGRAKTQLLFALMEWTRANRPELDVYSEVSLRVAPDSMPEPDLFVAPRQGFGPVPVDGVVLVIEVSDSTLTTDLGRKAELYAGANVPEYWVIDLEGGRIIGHADPGETGFAVREETPFGVRIVSATIGGLEIDTAILRD